MGEKDGRREGLRVGIDVGPTTVKAVAVAGDGSVVFSRYVRHGARQTATAAAVLGELGAAFERAMDGLIEGISAHGARGAVDAFPRGLEGLSSVPHDR